jgi:hypothetical protein
VIRRLVYIAFFLEVGLLLIVVPWSAFWEGNYFAAAWPALQPVVHNNFVRGAISGLGIVNVVAGFADLSVLFGARSRGNIPNRLPMGGNGSQGAS